jgi:hypothetical protein
MKPLDCDLCRLKARSIDTAVRWHYDAGKKLSANFQVVHDRPPCNDKGPEGYFNRSLPFEYVWKNMPEFISYISRNDRAKKELKSFVHRIEKDRSYIRRHTVDKKEVKKLIIRLEGFGEA